MELRRIDDTELVAARDLLVRGFPARPRAFWDEMLLRSLVLPVEVRGPVGYFLQDDGTNVGIMLTSRSLRLDAGRLRPVVNVSNWHIEPDYRWFAPLMMKIVLKQLRGDPDATITLLTAQASLWPMMEGVGFRVSNEGLHVVDIPLTSSNESGQDAAVVVDPTAARDLPARERALLADHAKFGCVSRVLVTGDDLHPLIFKGRFKRATTLPEPIWLAQLIYARDRSVVIRHLATIARDLCERGFAYVGIDGAATASIGPSVFYPERRYVHGPWDPGSSIDYAYSELLYADYQIT